MDEEINRLALLVYYFNVQIDDYCFNDVSSVNQWLNQFQETFLPIW